MYSCTSTSTGSGYLHLYLYICMHARSEKLHAGARKRAIEILWALPIQAVEIGTEPIKTIDLCPGLTDYLHEAITVAMYSCIASTDYKDRGLIIGTPRYR